MSFGKRLHQERLRRHLSQEALAEAIGVSSKSISRWEQDQAIPQGYARLELCRFFQLRPEDLFAGLEEQTPPAGLWSVPYSRNPFFTGRQELLQALHDHLNQQHTMALTQSLAISGLGGIGKTQIALEYTYQYREDYRFIFWTSAATRETLQADLAALAELLLLPERNEQDQNKILQAVRKWFATHDEWLWILDNADDVMVVHDLLPDERPGHLLLTSRAQAWGSLAQRIEVETMGLTEATLFLLRRARLLASHAFLDAVDEKDLAAAEAIVLEVDFLPLALDQAGAYIEEVGCSLSEYLALYRAHRKELLLRRGYLSTDHPEPVATTWSLSFEKVEQANPAAADLLRLCSFLEPDTIPEELIVKGSAHFSMALQRIAKDLFLLNEAIEELRKFSLIQRSPQTRTLRIHRLVQAVLQQTMTSEEQHRLAEQVVRATNMVFPEQIDIAIWPDCRRYLPQAQACSVLIQDYALTFNDAASLLFHTGIYLHDNGLYDPAESLFQQALYIRELHLGSEHPDVAQVLNYQAALYYLQGKYEQTERIYQQALHIWEESQGPEHPDVARPLIGLGCLFVRQGKYEQAEAPFQRALHIRELHLGSEHPDVAQVLNEQAGLYDEQGKYEQAEQLYQQALHIWEKHLGPEHPNVAQVLNNLAVIYYQQGKYEQAERLFHRALQIWEESLGPSHPQVAQVLNNLSFIFREQGKYEQGERLSRRALHIWEGHLGPQHPDVAFALKNLAVILDKQGKYKQAEPLHLRALHIREQALGPDNPVVTSSLMGLANFYQKQGKYMQAEPLYERALYIREQRLSTQHPAVADTLHDFAILREAQGKNQEAASLYQRALAIREQAFGPEHPTTEMTRAAYSALQQIMDRHDNTSHESNTT